MRANRFIQSAVMLVLFLSCGLVPATVLAQEENREQCLSHEYVISTAPVEALKDKAIEALDGVTNRRIDLLEETNRTALIMAQGPGEEGQVVDYDPRTDLCAKLEKLQRQQRLERSRSGEHNVIRRFSCSCNGVFKATRTPNDQFLSVLWGLNQPSNVDMNMPEAWDLATGSNQTVVAVIDSGVDYTHPDLFDNMWTNPWEIPGNGIDDDANGYVDDIHGINAITNSGNPMDDNGHGTHCAGSIGAKGNNSIGVVGVNWNVSIIGVKFLSASGSGNLYDSIKALDYVTALKNRGVNVVLSNNSWGGGGYWQPFADALARNYNAQLLFVAAAGNASNNNDTNPSYPASYNYENVISVAALEQNGNLASFSNYGASSVDIAAPGAQIGSTYPGNRYVYLSGTSMAAPHVSGLLALLHSYNPTLSWLEMRSRLFQTGRPLASLNGVVATGKLADAYALLASSAPSPSGPTPTPAPTATATPTPTPTGPPATPTSTPTPQPTAVPVPYPMTGSVTFGGVGLGGVALKLTYRGETVVRYTTANGYFNFGTFLSGEQWSIQGELSGYTFTALSGTLSGPATISIVPTKAGYTLSGRVLSGDGQPISNAIVSGVGSDSVLTDAAGRFSFSNVDRGTLYSLSVSAIGYEFEQNTVDGEIYGDVDRVIIGRK